uniref:Sugar phosphate transporter domain-containing protein n=1 Tax=Timema bartmani TaxID=61472 RepID=A0A7R9EWH1_9NEOP|nr:unnamed protein product [Timema bartmani]
MSSRLSRGRDSWENGKLFRENHPQCTRLGLNPDLPVLTSLVQHKSSALDHAATEAGTFQMLMTTICGFIQMYYPCGMYKPTSRLVRPPGFYRHMMLVGCTRFTTVILGLVALNYVAVSFTETIKSSAPLFTVLISRYLLGEATGLYVNLSLIPVMGGLALCSANELSFDARGFVAAMATNLTEW